MATASLATKTSGVSLPYAGVDSSLKTRHGGDLAIVSADYTIRAEWDTAYVVDVTVVVDCHDSAREHKSGLSGWKIEFSLPEDTKISKIWNAHLERDGSRCAALHEKFCSPVCRGRAVLYFGFEAKPSDPKKRVAAPPTFRVNGQVFGVTTSYARDLADCYYDYLFESRACSRSPSPEPAAASRSPSPDNREASPAPANESARQMPPHVHNNKRLRDSSPSSVADCRDTKKAKTTQAEEDEEKSIAQTPPRNFSPIEDSEVSDDKTWNNHCAHSRNDSNCVLQSETHTAPAEQAPQVRPTTSPSMREYPRTLEIDYYRRSKALKERKYLHMDYLDTCFDSREEVILATVLDQDSTVLEPNMFPYDCPSGVTHWTLWSKKWLTEDGITAFVNKWLSENMANAVEWNHDDNMSDGLSINLFHVHVYIRCPV